jgi:hypothetical protein
MNTKSIIPSPDSGLKVSKKQTDTFGEVKERQEKRRFVSGLDAELDEISRKVKGQAWLNVQIVRIARKNKKSVIGEKICSLQKGKYGQNQVNCVIAN